MTHSTKRSHVANRLSATRNGAAYKKAAHKRAALVFAGVTLGAVTASAPVFAQSSVTLYGIIDNSLVYQNSQTTVGSQANGHSNVKMVSGVWSGSRVGFKGAEDLGGGTKAIFQLESGYNSTNGGTQYSNAMFGRQAMVGLNNKTYGQLTFGRQYSSYYTLLAPYSPTTWMTGYLGAHPGDLDIMDTDYRHDSAIVYLSPKIYGFTFGGTYALGGVPGAFNSGATWSGAVQYQNGGFGMSVGYLRINNSTPGGGVWGANSTTEAGGQSGVSAVTNGYQTAAAQNRLAVSGGYVFTDRLDVTATYSNVQYVPGIASKFTDTAIFNTAGAVLHFKATGALDLAASYSYTWASKANGISSAAKYHQFNLTQYYALSKRTGVYLLEAFQRSNGQTLGTAGAGNIVVATAQIGETSPSSSRSQFDVVFGIVHRF